MLYLIHGEDEFLGKEKLAFFRQGSIKKYGDFNVTQFSGENINVENILGEINSLPFLGEKRVVILEDILTILKKDERKKIIEASLNSPDSTVIIFFENKDLLPYKAKDRTKDIEEFIKKIDSKNVFYYNNMDITMLNKWVYSRLMALGFSVEQKAVNGLVALVGNDTRQINSKQ